MPYLCTEKSGQLLIVEKFYVISNCLSLFDKLIKNSAASWRKWWGTCLPLLGSWVRILVTPCGLYGRQNRVCVGFLRVPPIFPYHKFHSTISPHSSHTFCFSSFHQPLWWCYRYDRLAPLLFTDLQYRGFIASHPLTWPNVDMSWGCYFIN